jgi:hypothetical protein
MDAIYLDDVNHLAPLVIAPPAPTETCLDVQNLTLESYNDDVSARSLLSLPKAQPYFFEADDSTRKKQVLSSVVAYHDPPGPPYLIADYCDDIIVHAPRYYPGKMRIIRHGDQHLQD